MKIFCIQLCLAVLVCNLCGKTCGYSVEDSTRLLQWAPLTLKKPYLTFLNNFYYASWQTRNSITKEEESLRHLQLPRGVPFSVVCGACFQASQTQTNLTISVSGHDYYSVPKMRRREVKQYRVGHLTCLMTYALTAPIHTSGLITCTLKRGRQQKIEVISFGVVDVSVDEAPEELEIQNTGTDVELHCPSPEQPLSMTNPLVHVWYQDPPTADPGSSLIPEMQSAITLRRSKYTRQVVCSVYNIGSPTKLYRTRFRVLGSQNMNRQEYQLTNELQEFEEDAEFITSQGNKLPSITVGIIITAAVICAIMIFVGIYQLLVVAKRK